MEQKFIYGTAWKKDETASCVLKALRSGFRAIDTACQPRHYREELVGEGIRQAFTEGVVSDRKQIWIQTKFTRPSGQDPENCPYDLNASIEEQVHTSVQTSLHHLRHNAALDAATDDAVYLDSIMMHSPFPDMEDTIRAWRVLSTYVPHRVRALGVCNISHGRLVQLYEAVDIKPAFVQNRLHPETNWETDQRRFCDEQGILFQAHKVLKQKEAILESDLIADVTASVGVSKQVALYLLVLGISKKITIINGTTSEMHMREDMDCHGVFDAWMGRDEGHQRQWGEFVESFKRMIGQ